MDTLISSILDNLPSIYKVKCSSLNTPHEIVWRFYLNNPPSFYMYETTDTLAHVRTIHTMECLRDSFTQHFMLNNYVITVKNMDKTKTEYKNLLV